MKYANWIYISFHFIKASHKRHEFLKEIGSLRKQEWSQRLMPPFNIILSYLSYCVGSCTAEGLYLCHAWGYEWLSSDTGNCRTTDRPYTSGTAVIKSAKGNCPWPLNNLKVPVSDIGREYIMRSIYSCAVILSCSQQLSHNLKGALVAHTCDSGFESWVHPDVSWFVCTTHMGLTNLVNSWDLLQVFSNWHVMVM